MSVFHVPSQTNMAAAYTVVAKRTGFPSYFQKHLKNKRFYYFFSIACRVDQVKPA